MKIEHVKIITFGGFKNVPALVDGGWAIVPYLEWGRGWNRHRFNVTHVGSGAAVAPLRLNKKRALKLLEDMKRVSWRDIPLGDIPLCELITNQKEIGETVELETGLKFNTDTLTIVKHAYNC